MSKTTDATGTETDVPFKPLPFKTPLLEIERRADGSILMRSAHDEGDAPATMAQLLADRASEFPDRLLLCERKPAGGPWTGVTYAEAKRAADGIAQWLIDGGFGADDAVIVLSDNSLEHGLMMLGCYTAGIPLAPVSAAYSLMSSDHAKLLHCFDVVKPRLIFVQDAAAYAPALQALLARNPGIRVVSVSGDEGTIAFQELTDTVAGDAVPAAMDIIGPDHVAKYLFTSGSTGMPKCVPQTHGMLVAIISAQEGLTATPVRRDVAAEFLEWMPWSHVSAGNVIFNTVLWDAGTLYLDAGRPTRDRFETTIKNLYEVSPRKFGSAPIAFAMLAEAMENDVALRQSFFRNLEYMGYGGAALSNDVYGRLQTLAIAETGRRVPLLTSYGATETQPVTMVHWQVERAGLVGLPMPGVMLKLVPNGSKLELRAKGPSVMPGYFRSPEANARAFDEEGFYCLGDAVRFVDEAMPEKGLLFDGRVAEDFKLASGTWVSVGTLRPELIAACSPYVQDMIITGQDEEFAGALIWPSAAELARLGDVKTIARKIAGRIANFNATSGGASRKIGRFLLLTSPPSIDSGEMTDKGYINQRAALHHRHAEVAQIYAQPLRSDVIIPTQE